MSVKQINKNLQMILNSFFFFIWSPVFLMIWKINEEDDKLIDLFYNSSLRIILKITYQNHVKMTELLQFASIELFSIEV